MGSMREGSKVTVWFQASVTTQKPIYSAKIRIQRLPGFRDMSLELKRTRALRSIRLFITNWFKNVKFL